MKQSKPGEGGKKLKSNDDDDNDGGLAEIRLCLNRPQRTDSDKYG